MTAELNERRKDAPDAWMALAIEGVMVELPAGVVADWGRPGM
jgi:hypothetical protein